MERTKARNVAVGVFYNQAEAQRAVSELKSAGFTEEEIGVVAHDAKGTHRPQIIQGEAGTHKETKAAEGATAGVMAGAGVGALWALGIAAGILPAIGPVVAGGILGSILLSAAGGAAVAGVAGALIGLGVPEEEANYYEQEFKAGHIIVTVRAAGRYDEAVTIMQRHNGFDMKARASRPHSALSNTATEQASCTTTQPTRTAQTREVAGRTNTASATRSTQQGGEGPKEVRLHDEELDVRKRAVKKGEVRVAKEIVTEHKMVDVPITREEVVIERRPAGTTSAAAEKMGDRQEIRIPVSEEEVEVHKRMVAREDVTVGKRRVQETRKVSQDLRHEKLKVERSGDVNVKQTSK